jgi:hypothetical protein
MYEVYINATGCLNIMSKHNIKTYPIYYYLYEENVPGNCKIGEGGRWRRKPSIYLALFSFKNRSLKEKEIYNSNKFLKIFSCP